MSCKTLLAHEWLAPRGGSENVFEQLALIFPEADLQCLWNDSLGRFGAGISETWLARTPLRKSKAAALPFMPAAWRAVDLGGYDRVLVSSHAFAHQLASRAAANGKQAFSYVHTPARYVWFPELDGRGDSAPARAVAGRLKRIDRSMASPRVSYAANSEFVRDRIRGVWGVDARVIYPPVDVERILGVPDWSEKVRGPEVSALDALPNEFILGASRLVEYKRLDVAIKVGELLGLPVVIAGEGPHLASLRQVASSVKVPVVFMGRVSDEMLYTLYQRAMLFVFMAIEDFGIMPVEAMSLGTPALVNAIGGAAESVRIVGGGEAARSDDSSQVLKTAAESAAASKEWNPADIQAKFGNERFGFNVKRWIEG